LKIEEPPPGKAAHHIALALVKQHGEFSQDIVPSSTANNTSSTFSAANTVLSSDDTSQSSYELSLQTQNRKGSGGSTFDLLGSAARAARLGFLSSSSVRIEPSENEDHSDVTYGAPNNSLRRGSDPTTRTTTSTGNPNVFNSIRAPSLDKTHFQAEHTYEWAIPGFGRVKFTDFAPLAFKAVRARFGFTRQDLENALTGPCKAEVSAGKSESGTAII
jgi:hypothetical protein